MHFVRMKPVTAFCLSACITVSGFLILPQAEAIKPLSGKATYSEQSAWHGKRYRETNKTVKAGFYHLNKYSLEKAEEYFEAVLSDNPEHPGANHGMATLIYYRTTSSNQILRDKRAAMIETAITHTRVALRMAPHYLEARLTLGELYQEQGRLNDSQEEFARVLEADENNHRALVDMGHVLIEKHQYTSSDRYLKQAAEMSPQHPKTMLGQGIIQKEKGMYQQAYDTLNHAASIAPNNAPIRYHRGDLYQKQGNTSAAVKEYEKALSIKPEYRDPAQKLADLYSRRGDHVLALGLLKNLAGSYRHDFDLMMQVGRLSQANNQAEQASLYYRKALLINPDSVVAKNGLSSSKTQLASTSLMRADTRAGRLTDEVAANESSFHAMNLNPRNEDAHLIQVRMHETLHGPFHKTGTIREDDFHRIYHKPETTIHDSFLRGETLLDRYQFAEAFKSFDKAIKGSQKHEDTVAFGEMLLTIGLPSQAEMAFQRLGSKEGKLGLNKSRNQKVQSQKLLTEALRYKKHTSRRAKRLPESMLLESLELNLANTQAHMMLAEHYTKRDMYGKALDHYYAVLSIEPAHPNAQGIQKRMSRLQKKLAKERAQR